MSALASTNDAQMNAPYWSKRKGNGGLRTCLYFSLWAPHEYFLATLGALRAASLGWGWSCGSCPWCKLSPMYLRQSGFAPRVGP